MSVMNEWGVTLLKSNADININYNTAVLEPLAWYWKTKPWKSFAWILVNYIEVALIMIDQDVVGRVSIKIQFYKPFLSKPFLGHLITIILLVPNLEIFTQLQYMINEG